MTRWTKHENKAEFFSNASTLVLNKVNLNTHYICVLVINASEYVKIQFMHKIPWLNRPGKRVRSTILSTILEVVAFKENVSGTAKTSMQTEKLDA